MKDRGLKLYKTLSIIFFLAFLVAIAYIFSPNLFYTNIAPLTLPEISTDGFVKTNVTAEITDENTAALTLSNSCYALTASVEPAMALSIIDAQNNQVGPRPNAHDLSKDVFNALKIDVLMTKITQRRENFYVGKIVLRQGNTVLNFDVRPSDGIAIALRMNAPVYLNETLLHSEGKKIC